jgi:Glycosyltransferase family 87/WD40-like Beta Propeller Repeat
MSGEANLSVVGPNGSRSGSRYPQSAAIAEWILLAALLAVFAGRGFLPAWRTLNTDFPNYYLAASLYHRGIPLDRVYEWIWFQRQKDYLDIQQPEVGFIPNPPMCALPVLPLSLLSPLAAKRAWLVLNLGFVLLALGLLHRVTKLSWRRAALISLLCIMPLRTNFLCGQYYVLILLLICAAYYSSCLNHRLTSGLLLSAAASLKFFPALFLILFIRKRDWRSAAGLILGTAALTAISVAIFGLEVHRILLIEVLPRALRGELVGPYSLQWSSLTALWHHLFLFEPELNPSPLVNSPVLYALTQALTGVGLLFGFLWVTNDDSMKPGKALEWSALVPLLLLSSSMPASYHYCILIFTAVVGFDELLKITDKRKVLAFILLFSMACAPVPGRIAALFLPRLVGTLALYVLLLQTLASDKGLRVGRKWVAVAALASAVLAMSNLRPLKNRTEDFRRRLSNASTGYSASNPVAMGGRVVFTEMLGEKYAAMALENNGVRAMPFSGDVLSVGGSERGAVGYFENVTRQSSIMQLPLTTSSPIPEYVAEGEQPKISPDGRWLVFIREEYGRTTVWLSEAQSPTAAQLIINGVPSILDVSVTPEGDLIAAAGAVSGAHLIMVRRSTGVVEPLSGIAGPARYPSISPDGKRLAFSRRKWGSWQLVVRELASGVEQQLTHTACNATLPSWEDTHTLLYATDCGRGLGLSALARVALQD